MGALADPRFRRLLVGSSLSSFGDSALYLSLAISAKDLTGSNAAAGAIFLAQGLPSLLAPATGHLFDRVPRRPLLIMANTATALGVLTLLLIRDQDQLWLMYAVAAFYGTSFLIMGSASAGLLKDLLPDSDLASANATLATIGQGLRIASPLAGAALYAQFGGGALAVLDAATFVVAVVMLVTVRVVESPIPLPDRITVHQRLMVGYRYVRSTRVLAQITTAAVIAMLVLGFYESMTFAIIARLGRPPSFFGVLMSVQGAGSILGGLVATRIIRRIGETRTLGIALVAWALASAIYLIPALAAALVAVTVFGIAVPLYAIAFGTTVQRFTPSRLVGRVGSTTTMFTNLSQTISIAIGASLIDLVDYRIGLITVIVVAVGAALPVLIRPAAVAPNRPDPISPAAGTSCDRA
ncbi:MAG: MFS transporter [Propionibacteriaceae bacterium]